MSLHSYTRCWLHLIWATLNRQAMLSKVAGAELSKHLHEYSKSKGVYMKTNYVNSDHVHALIDLPTHLAIEETLHLFKGESSHWVNENQLVVGKFAWGRGYGAFSVSESNVAHVATYIAKQEEHHRKRSFLEEYQTIVDRYGLVWREESNR